jgi:hypothetical protein
MLCPGWVMNQLICRRTQWWNLPDNQHFKPPPSLLQPLETEQDRYWWSKDRPVNNQLMDYKSSALPLSFISSSLITRPSSQEMRRSEKRHHVLACYWGERKS